MTGDENKMIVYMRLRKKMRFRKGATVHLGQIAELIADPSVEPALRAVPIYESKSRKDNMVMIDVLHVMRKLRESYPQMQLEHIGEPHTLVEFYVQTKKPNLVLLIFVWILLFIGSGLAIMNFHADVSMMAVHQRIYELVTGARNEHPYLLQIPYSIGIGAGMMLFFNHWFKKKINDEPSPLEVEMYTYQENVHRRIIADEYAKRE